MDKYELQKEFKDKIDEAFHSLIKLENKKDEITGRTLEQLDEKIDALQAKKDQMDSLYEELLSGSDEKSQEVRDKLEKSMINFREGVKEVADIF